MNGEIKVTYCKPGYAWGYSGGPTDLSLLGDSYDEDAFNRGFISSTIDREIEYSPHKETHIFGPIFKSFSTPKESSEALKKINHLQYERHMRSKK